MSTIKLRPYQKKIIDDARKALETNKGILICSPTGSGKTAINSFITKSAVEKGNFVWFIVHRQELIKQSAMAFDKVNLDYGIVAAGYKLEPQKKIQICSIMTLINRLDKLPAPKVIVEDESQYMAAKSWDKIYNTYPNAFHIGLSATPWRLDKKGFKKYFQEIVYGPSVEWLIENKYLSDYRLFAPTNFDASVLKTKMGDYDLKQTEELMIKSQIVGGFFDVWKKHAYNKKTIVFAPTVNMSKIIVDEFLKNGISACHLDAETKKLDRDKAIKDYADGKITILSNVKLFTEGFDVPSIECVMLARPTKSLALYLQMVGRALRPQEGKPHAIILDQVNSCRSHGLPDDKREWSLDDRESKRKKKNSGDEDSVKICPECFCAVSNFSLFCDNCGHQFELKKRTGPEQVDGELSEIDKKQFKLNAKKEQSEARTLDQLIELGKKRQYDYPVQWANKIMSFRRGKRK